MIHEFLGRLDAVDFKKEEHVVRILDRTPHVDQAEARLPVGGGVGIKHRLPRGILLHPIAT